MKLISSNCIIKTEERVSFAPLYIKYNVMFELV